jgi:hypothetical protein
MRLEMKIALLAFAANAVLGHLLQAPEFVRGLLLGLSILFMAIGLLPNDKYVALKKWQQQKRQFIRGLVRI